MLELLFRIGLAFLGVAMLFMSATSTHDKKEALLWLITANTYFLLANGFCVQWGM